jgi:hypothetical protein
VDDLAGDRRRRSGGDPVVEDDHRAPGEGYPWSGAPEPADLIVELRALPGLDRGEVLRGDVRQPLHLLVEDPRAAFGDGTHRELRLEGRAELADPDDVQRGAQRPRDLVCDGYPAPRKPDDHDVLPTKMRQPTAKQPAGLHTITKNHTGLLGPLGGSAIRLYHSACPGSGPPTRAEVQPAGRQPVPPQPASQVSCRRRLTGST